MASENTKTQASRVLCFKRVSRVTEEGHIQKWTQQRLPTSYCKRKSWLPWLEIKVRDKSNRETPTMLQGAIFPHPGQQRLPVLELEHHLRPLEILQLPPILQRQCSANTGRSLKHPHQKGNSINGACSSFSIAVLHYFFIFVSLFLEISSHSVVHYQTLKLTMYPKKVSNSRHYPTSNAGITGVNHYTWFSCSSFELVPETLESIWYLS